MMVPSPEIQQGYTELWRRFDSDANIKETSTIEEALGFASRFGHQAKRMQVLITGSQHLVGGALQFLEPDACAHEIGLQPS